MNKIITILFLISIISLVVLSWMIITDSFKKETEENLTIKKEFYEKTGLLPSKDHSLREFYEKINGLEG